MSLKTALTGSYPILPSTTRYDWLSISQQNSLAVNSILRAVSDQIEIGIDIVVDGQTRQDILSIFCSNLPGIEGREIPYYVTGRVRPADKPILLNDYLVAQKLAARIPVKAHITGPMTLAQGLIVKAGSPYKNSSDPSLIGDLAVALGEEARHLVIAGAKVVQIDEPVLAFSRIDLDLAFAALKKIIDIARIPSTAIHVCGNITNLLYPLLIESPIKVISIEGMWLHHEKFSNINRNTLSNYGKLIGLGCISVNHDRIERLASVQNFIDQILDRFGEENIWAITPDCGLRLLPYPIVRQKLDIMIAAAKSF